MSAPYHRLPLALALAFTLGACRHGASPSRALATRRPHDAHHPELVVQSGHHADLTALAFAANGRMLATGSGDRTAKLWDLAARRELDTFDLGTEVNAVALSPDGKLLAVGTGERRDGTIALFEVATGLLRRELGLPGRKILALAFSPDGALLASGGADGRGPELVLWDVATGAERARLAGHSEPISAVAFSGDGQTLVSGGWDLAVKAWSVADPSRPPRELGKLGTDRARALDVAGSIAAFDAGGKIGVVDLATGAVIRELDGAGPLVLDRSAKTLACVASRDGRADVRVLDVATGAERARITGASEIATPALAFSADGALLATGAFGGALRLFDPSTGRELGALAAEASYFAGAGFTGGGEARVASLGGDGLVSTWDLVLAERTGSVPLPLAGSSPLALAVATAQPRALAAARDGKVWVVDLGTPIVSSGTVERAKVRGGLPATTDLASVAVSADGKVGALGTNRGRLVLADLERVLVTEEVALAPLAQVFAVALDRDGRTAAAGVDQQVVVRARGGELVTLGELDDTVSALAFSSDGARLAAGTFSGELAIFSLGASPHLEGRWRGHDTKVRGLGFDASGAKLASSSEGGGKVWDVATRSVRTSVDGHTGGVPSIGFGAGDRLILTAGWDGMLGAFGAEDGVMRAKLIAIGKNDFVVATRANEYRASRGGLRGVAFRFRDRVFPFEQFDALLDRPERVLERLGLAPRALIDRQAAATARRREKLGFTEGELGDDLFAPGLTLVSAEPPVSVRTKHLELEVLAEAPSHGLDRIMVWANDVPVFGSAGIDVKAAGKSARRTIGLDLADGVNKLQLSAVDRRGVESLRLTFVVRYDGPPTPRDLYVVVAGVSKYGAPERDLGYPAKDARDLVTLFEARASKVPRGAGREPFRAVKSLVLLDRDATRARVLGARAFLEASRPDDQVIVFVAGHGLVDAEGRYAWATVDADFDRPVETGLAFEGIEGLLDGIPAREKLLLVDTCHAGELSDDAVSAAATEAAELHEGGVVRVRGLRSKTKAITGASAPTLSALRDLFADLRRGSGATVIAAAGGAELAYESTAWNNGVFTYAILEGLRDGKADGDGDGIVRASELRDYVIDRVRALTFGVQVPAMRRENIESDFRVY